MEEASVALEMNDFDQSMTTDPHPRTHLEFNQALVEAIEEVLRELFSPQVVDTLFKVLLDRYDVARDEIPYRLDTVYKILKDVFGTRGGGTLSRSIARRFYKKLDLPFQESPNLELIAYVEIAKSKLLKTTPSTEKHKNGTPSLPTGDNPEPNRQGPVTP